MATSGRASGSEGSRKSAERAAWRESPPQAGCSASVGPPAVAKSCCSASTQGES